MDNIHLFLSILTSFFFHCDQNLDRNSLLNKIIPCEKGWGEKAIKNYSYKMEQSIFFHVTNSIDRPNERTNRAVCIYSIQWRWCKLSRVKGAFQQFKRILCASHAVCLCMCVCVCVMSQLFTSTLLTIDIYMHFSQSLMHCHDRTYNTQHSTAI